MKFDTGYPADSVEFCPAPGLADILVCGTYKLLEIEDAASEADNSEGASSSRRRIGKTMLFETSGEGNLTLLQEVESSAVLDLKWSGNALAVAESEGRIGLLRLNQDEKQLHTAQTLQCRDESTLCLSLDWSNKGDECLSDSLVASFSDGTLSILRPADGVYSDTLRWHAHDYEPWVAAWNYWDRNVVFSGGDDLCLKGWDIRTECLLPIFTNKRFEAGVTAIQTNPHIEHVFAVGSYDEKVRIFDARKPQVPLIQAEVGGGAWRVKWHSDQNRKTYLLVACMHDGFKVVNFPSLGDANAEGDTQEWKVTKRFDEHTNLAYGVDWNYCGEMDASEATLVASCSFYDHTLHTWRG